MATKIQCQVKYQAKHYWKELSNYKGDKTGKKFAKRRLLCGQGATRLNGEVVAHGDIIEVDDISELGNAIDKFVILNPQDVETNQATVEGHEKMTRKKKGLKKVEREDGDWDVINRDTGLKINDEPLTKKEASSMVKASRK